MISKICGAIQFVIDKMPCEVNFPRLNHNLNLSISKGCHIGSIKSIWNSFGQIKKVVSFFNASSRQHFLFYFRLFIGFTK